MRMLRAAYIALDTLKKKNNGELFVLITGETGYVPANLMLLISSATKAPPPPSYMESPPNFVPPPPPPPPPVVSNDLLYR